MSSLIEADDDLAIDDRDGRGHIAQVLELLQGFRIRRDIGVFERNPFGCKKLLRPMAEHSSRLGIDDDLLLAHRCFLPCTFDPGASVSDYRGAAPSPRRWPDFSVL
jgi:hypothetical protein